MYKIIKINGSKVTLRAKNGNEFTIPIEALEGDEVKDKWLNNHNHRSINKHLFVWVGAFLFGGIGVDRFMRGQVGLGICKILFGWLTLGIWYLVDLIIALTKAYGSVYGYDDEVIFDRSGRYVAILY